MSLRNFWKKEYKAAEGGFTLLEMTFVFVIFAVMSSIVLFNFRSFNTKVQFNNLVQDIALRVVTAQKSAISGATNVNFLGQSAKPTYGVYFEPGITATPESTRFVYFNDIAPTGSTTFLGDKLYNPPAGGTCPNTPTVGNECLSITAISTGEYISNVCYIPIGDTSRCTTTGGVNISFTRPFPDANIFVDAFTSSGPVAAQIACIELSSTNSSALKKTITVSNLGELHTIDGAANAAASPCHP